MKRVYFVGIGGIGMAALARYYMATGLPVAGYDRTPSELTSELAAAGAAVSYADSMEAIPEEYRQKEGTTVIYTPAIPADNVPLSYFRKGGFEPIKRSVALGRITAASKGLCFSGTHGKTTTSSMAAHMLHNTATGCNAFLGGILRNYHSNLLLSPTSPYTVIEADEYDRSFHTLHPYIAVVTATDPDHLDIYGTEEAYLESFAHFTSLVSEGGALIVHTGLKLKPRPREGVRLYTYGVESGDFHAANIRHSEGSIIFDNVACDGHVIKDIELGVPVEINIDNAVAAMAAVYLTGAATDEEMRTAMATFQGAERRFQFLLKEDISAGGHVVIDDYAHHPDEVRCSIESVRRLYPGRRLTVAFQPHLYTRTRDFAPQFAEALSLADDVVLLPIYPAREEPIEGVNSEMLLKSVNCNKKQLISKENFVNFMKDYNFEVLLALGAGDMSFMLPELVAAIKNKIL